MANRKATMTDLRVIIREFAKGTPLREIERKVPMREYTMAAQYAESLPQITLPAESKRPDGILDKVVVDVDPAVVHVARQTGKKTKGLSEPALGQDFA